MNTDLKRIHFLLEAEAELSLAQDSSDNIEAARNLPPYITNYIGSKHLPVAPQNTERQNSDSRTANLTN